MVTVLLATLLAVQVSGAPPLRPDETQRAEVTDEDPVVRTDWLNTNVAAPAVARAFKLRVEEGGDYHIDLRAYLFDPYLILRDAAGTVLTEDDDGLVGIHARIVARLEPGARYTIEACALHGHRGPFELTLRRGLPETLPPAEKAEADRREVERRLARVKATYGEGDPRTAFCLNVLGHMASGRGELGIAEGLYRRAYEIRSATLGPDHRDTLNSLERLGILEFDRGRYDEALAIHRQVHERKTKALGPDDPAAIVSLHNIAACLMGLDNDEEALPWLRESLRLRERHDPSNHRQLAQTLTAIGQCLIVTGEYKEAEVHLARALRIRERVDGALSSTTAASILTYASVIESMGNMDRALSLTRRAVEISERLSDSRGAARALASLAKLEYARREYTAAWTLAAAVQDSLQHAELGAFAVLALEVQAHSAMALGDFEAAAVLWEAALEKQVAVHGAGHPRTGTGRNNLAALWSDAGRLEDAWHLMLAGRFDQAAFSAQLIPAITENGAYAYLASDFVSLEMLLSLAGEVDEPATAALAYQAVLDWKGQVARYLTTGREQADPHVADGGPVLARRFSACQRRISALAFRGGAQISPDEFTALIDERARLEIELRRLSGGSRSAAAKAQRELSAAIPPSALLIDFLVHRLYVPASFEDGSAVERGHWTEPHVMAWIAGAGLEGTVRVDLGPAAEIGERIRDHLVSLRASLDLPEDVAEGLRASLWDPIIAAAGNLEGIDTLFVSPDGVLGLLPFETLKLEDGSFLLERYAVVYLPHASVLSKMEQESAPTHGALLAAGGIDFNARQASKSEKGRTAPVGMESLRGNFTDSWEGLTHTGSEVRRVVELHRASPSGDDERVLLLGSKPTEERIKSACSSFTVLHLATHGFFHPEGLSSIWDEATAVQSHVEPGHDSIRQRLEGRHPGLLSGLVLAGANVRDSDWLDDGYLTAEEVGWLDLSNTELVVLSACDTGLGRPQSGEGMLGLRRAFHIAGAKTVVSSLWAVKDDSTAELMESFYTNLWERGMGRGEALRAAQLEMLRKNREEHAGRGVPRTWGAFVLSGEWR